MADDFSLQGISDAFGQGNIWQTDQFQPALQNFADSAGYSGDLFGDSYSYNAPTINEGGDSSYSADSRYLNPNLISAMKGYSFRPTGENMMGMFKGNSLMSNQEYGDKDSWFDKLANTAIPMAIGAGFGGGLSGLFGGGTVGNALGYGLAGGGTSVAQGGNFGQGFLSGAIGGGLNGMAQGTAAVAGNNPSAYVPASSGTSFSSMAGISNPTMAGMFNRGVGNAVGAIATGKTGNEALQSGLTGAALSGINSAGASGMDIMGSGLKSWLGSGNEGLPDNLMGSGGDMSGMTDVSPNRYDEMSLGSDNMSSYNPSYAFGGDQSGNTSFMGMSPQKTAQSASGSDFSMPASLSNMGSRLGNYALNNAGDLASMLYGFYNNRRQQNALGQQINSLQGMYGQNSPYAQQMRASLAAKAAQQGRRSNIGAREVQLQAALADRAAQMQPTLMQLNQARGGLQNSMGSNMLSMLNKSGAFNGLGSLFGNNPYSNYSMQNNTGNYNMLGMLEGGR